MKAIATVEFEYFQTVGRSVEREREMRRRKAGKDAEKQATVEENPADQTKKRKGISRCKNQIEIEAIENKRSASSSQEDEEPTAEAKEGGSGFFGCYLLTSLSPRFKGCTYIGFVYDFLYFSFSMGEKTCL